MAASSAPPAAAAALSSSAPLPASASPADDLPAANALSQDSAAVDDDAPFARRVIAWQRSHGRHRLPWQGTRDPYRVWLSEIMLQQTQVATVLGYYERFLQRFRDVRALAAAPLDEVLALWSGLGYYSRARNLHRCAAVVVAEHGGEFPRTSAELTRLPGIGRSTAAAIAAFCFGERAAILDGNVRRVLSRLLGFEGDLSQAAAERELWRRAEELLPRDDEAKAEGGVGVGGRMSFAPEAGRVPLDQPPRACEAPASYSAAAIAIATVSATTATASTATATASASASATASATAAAAAAAAATAADADTDTGADARAAPDRAAQAATAHDDIAVYTQGLMDLGATICTPRAPRCLLCPAAGLCVARREGTVLRYPVKSRRTKERPRREGWWLWLECGGRVLLEQRPPSGVWAGLWTLPLYDDPRALAAAAARLGVRRTEALPPVAHALTHFDWLLHPCRAVIGSDPPAPQAVGAGRWFEADELRSLALPAPLRRLLAARPAKAAKAA